ncbi:MAG TPA: thioesterase family protein [Myxococcales bacterium LLY-WYZ-16_1]|nr:thioesterase family protein [Myxococcales bacterium LLY-WYZ-16_1]
MLSHRHRLRVIYGDTDRMGIVYYANHFRYFEAGRNELLRKAGISYREMETQGALLPVAEATARYRNPAHYDDELELETWIEQIGTSSLRIRYRLTRPSDGVLIATGETRHACVDRDGRIRRMPAEIKEKLSAHGHDA